MGDGGEDKIRVWMWCSGHFTDPSLDPLWVSCVLGNFIRLLDHQGFGSCQQEDSGWWWRVLCGHSLVQLELVLHPPSKVVCPVCVAKAPAQIWGPSWAQANGLLKEDLAEQAECTVVMERWFMSLIWNNSPPINLYITCQKWHLREYLSKAQKFMAEWAFCLRKNRYVVKKTISIRFIFHPFDLCKGGELGIVVGCHPKFRAFTLLPKCNTCTSGGFCGFVICFKLGTRCSGCSLSCYICVLNEQIVCVVLWGRRDAGVDSCTCRATACWELSSKWSSPFSV